MKDPVNLVSSDGQRDAAFILGGSMLLCAAMLAAGMFYAAREIQPPVTHTHVAPPAATVNVAAPQVPVDVYATIQPATPKVLMLQVGPEVAQDIKDEQLAEPILPLPSAAAGRGVPAAAPSAASTLEALDIGQYGTLLPKPKDVK